MNLNSEIFGTKDDNAVSLVSGSGAGSCYYSNKAGASDIKAYYDTYGHNEPIDESVNYWQIADDSMFNSFCFLRLTGQSNALDIATVRATKPLSFFLTKVGSTQRNITFDPAANSNTIWENDVYGTSFYSNNWKIIPWFDYNRILLRPSLTVVKLDENGNPTGSAISTGDKSKIYNFFHDNENDIPIREQYAILAINLRFLLGSADNTSFAYDAYDYLYFSTSTEIDSPYPNAYRTAPFRTYQTLGSMTVGYGGLSLHNFLSNVGSFGMNTNSSNLYIYDPRFWEIKTYVNTQNQTRYYFNFTGSYDDLMHQIATLGFWFRDDVEGGTYSATGANAKTIGENCTSENCCLPEIIGGKTTGNFKRGSQAGADPQSQWSSDWRENVGYTGDKPYSNDNQNTGDLTTIFNRPVIGGSCNYYNAIGSDIINLTGFINSGYQPADEDQFIVDFKGVNPADYISSILYYPTGFTAGKLTESGTPVEIAIGALSTTGVYMIPADAGSQNIVSFSPLPLQQYYHDFRDYAPYTSLDLYVPFCGSVELDPAIYLGHTLQVYLFIDFPTGNCTAAIMCDGLVHDTISGSCGVSVPLTAANIGSYQNAIKSAEIALKQAEMQRKSAWIGLAASTGTLLAGAATGNALMIAGAGAGVLSSALNIGKADLNVRAAEYQLEHIAPSIRSVSAASPANSICLDYDCHLLIKRPFEVPVNDSVYSETIGNACCITDVLSAFHGLTVCNSVYISDIISDYISIDDNTYGGNAATAQEMALIQQSLANGVYLP